MQADKTDIRVDSPNNPARHHHPGVDNLHTMVVRLFTGVNLGLIAGINDYTMLRLLAEVGYDMSRFPTLKHFIGWLGLSPKNKQSGKMEKRIKAGKGSCAGEIFRQSAQGLVNSKHNAIGAFIRRLAGRKGTPIAIKAGAREIAAVFYNALTKGMDCVEQGAEEYIKKLYQRELSILNKLAKKHNCGITNNQSIA